MPASLTRTHAVSGVAPAACTEICGGPFEYLTALSSRLVDRRAQVVDIAADDERRLQIAADDGDGVFSEVMARARRIDALLDQPAEIDRRALFELALCRATPARNTCSTVCCRRSASCSMMR